MWRFLLACQGGEEATLAPVDYQADVVPMMRTWCTACHGQIRSEAGLTLDTLEALRASGGAALSQMEAGVMPPGGGLRDAEIQAFARWLEAGAPGEELQPIAPQERAPDGVAAVETDVHVLQQGQEFLMLTALANSGQGVARETWRYDEGRIALVERALYRDQELLSTDSWEPALVLYDPELSAWIQSTEHTRVDALGEQRWPEEWSAQAWDDVDARAVGFEVLGNLVEEAGGARVGLMVSGPVWVARVHDEPLDAGLESHQTVRVALPPSALLEDGAAWTERVISW